MIDSKIGDHHHNDQNCSSNQNLNSVDNVVITSNEMSEETTNNLNQLDSTENEPEILNEKMIPDQDTDSATTALANDIQLMREIHDQEISSMKETVDNQSRLIEEILVS